MKREPSNGVLPRGFMVKADDTLHWHQSKDVFYSIPAAKRHIKEKWFTQDHNHDLGATQDYSIHPALLIPENLRKQWFKD
jgi:hypothetical protein